MKDLPLAQSDHSTRRFISFASFVTGDLTKNRKSSDVMHRNYGNYLVNGILLKG